MQNDGPVRSSQLPPVALTEKEFSIYPFLSFSNQESCFPSPLHGSLGLPYPSSIMQLQQTRVTKETIKHKTGHGYDTINIRQQQRIISQIPTLSQVELSSLNGLRAWGRDRTPTMTSPSSWY